MTTTPPQRSALDLRNQAEARLALRPTPPPASDADTQRLLHELQVHQIELEMQNESLRQMQVQTEDARQRVAEMNMHLEEIVAHRTAELVSARDAAEAANRAKSAFLANMSHELRTPMTAIMGMTELALRRATDAKQADQLRAVVAASEHLLHIINEVLDISKIVAGRLQLEHVEFVLGEVRDNVVSLIGQKASDNGLKFLVSLEPGLAARRFKGDPTRLGQVLLNLVGNAVKFTNRGEITVRASLVEEHPGEVLLRWDIIDTGIGIDAEAQSRLFNAFEQADNSMTRKYGGTGLGLAISKRLVTMMGGEIGVESALGKGSAFWFTVRLDKAGNEATRPATNFKSRVAEDSLRSRRSAARILLADDDPGNRDVSRSLLEDVGFVVDEADNGQQALELARQGTYALILMDIQMPVMNGIDASQDIRALPGYAQTPIIAMTANAFDEDRQSCIDAGMNEHLAKPVSPQKLYETIQAWLEKTAKRPRT